MFDMNEVNDGKVLAIVGYLFSFLFFLPLLKKPKSAYGVFHANHQLVMLILSVASSILSFIPILGIIVTTVVWVFNIICMILGIMSALKGVVKPLPLIGKIKILK